MAPVIARMVALVAMGAAILCGAGPAAAATLHGGGLSQLDPCVAPTCLVPDEPGVRIKADGVAFGGKGKGFTITRAPGHGSTS